MDDPASSGERHNGAFSAGTAFGQYVIRERLGIGGMGEVYLATDTKLDRPVALKFLPDSLRADPEARQRLLREAKAASKLNHKNILTIHSVEDIEGRDFIVMEHVEGQSLQDLINEGALTTEQIIRISQHIADGLATAHSAGVIHRDIKSANVFITQQGQAKIMDFGLATWRGATQLTKEGATLGTLSYSSPEQVQGRDIDHRSDLFSLGVVVSEMITGRLPFGGEHEAAVIYSIVNEQPEPLARFKTNVSPGIQDIVNKALQKDPELRYQSAEDMLADLKREKRALAGGDSQPSGPAFPAVEPKRRVLSLPVVIASIVVVVALMLLLLKPWRLELATEQEAAAAEDRLAVMYFENMVEPDDPRRLGEIAANLLITDLSESQYIRVVSSQRLYDILKLLGREGAKVIEPGVATRVAEKAGARWMLTGSILQIEPEIVITTQLVEVSTGNVITSQRMTGLPGMSVFDLVDQLTVEIKSDLELPADALAESDPNVVDLTTASSDAYRYYLEGKEHFYRYKYLDAEESFRHAIEIDSSFAMAYYGLSLVHRLAGGGESQAAIDKAVEHIERVNRKERGFILARRALLYGDFEDAQRKLEGIVDEFPDEKEAYFRLGRISQLFGTRGRTLAMFNKAIEVDSMFIDAYNVLAYGYQHAGDFEKSLWMINKYIELAPNEPNPYDSRGDLYALSGRLDDAIASYQKALQVDPSYATSLYNLGNAYLYRRQYGQAESAYQALIAHPDKNARAGGREGLALIAIHQGRFTEALRRLDLGIETDRMEECSADVQTNKLVRRLQLYWELGDFDAALADAEMARQVLGENSRANQYYHVLRGMSPILHEAAGRTEVADSLAGLLESDFAQGDSAWPGGFWAQRGHLEFERGNYDSATANFQRAIAVYRLFIFNVGLARTHLAAGRLGDAVDKFERAMSIFGPTRDPLTDVKLRYWLGIAYEKSGWTDKAMAQYEEFLKIWKDADPGIPEIDDAKARLATLKQVP